jgi:hypothetical protein
MKIRVLFVAAALMLLSTMALGQPAYIYYSYYFCPVNGGNDQPMTGFPCWEGTPIPDGACDGTICVYEYPSTLLGCYIQGFNSGLTGCDEGFFAADYPITWYSDRQVYCVITYISGLDTCIYSTYDHPYTTVVGADFVETDQSWWTCTCVNHQPEYDFDLGDLGVPPPFPVENECFVGPQFAYPTDPCIVGLMNGPGHWLSNIAWLGSAITGDIMPNVQDMDAADDGVVFLDAGGWYGCQIEVVQVTVTGGANYEGQLLYLSGWKDGNLDGDFGDTLCDGRAPEWIIQSIPIVPCVLTFPFMDPGCPSPLPFTGVFRFRLTSEPQTADSWMGGCDWLGEVEDYYRTDLPVPVELVTFEATAGDREVTLRWTTASERDNARFEIQRKTASNDWRAIGTVDGSGNSQTTQNYEYADRSVTNGVSYTYRLLSYDINGTVHEYDKTAEATPLAPTPREYALHQNYPNPFNPVTSISFDLAQDGIVNLRVYNLMGQEVAQLVTGHQDAGRHAVTFDGGNLPSGLYICRLAVNQFVAQRKMLLMK